MAQIRVIDASVRLKSETVKGRTMAAKGSPMFVLTVNAAMLRQLVTNFVISAKIHINVYYLPLYKLLRHSALLYIV